MTIRTAMEKISCLLTTLQLTLLGCTAALTLSNTSSTCPITSAHQKLALSTVTPSGVILTTPEKTASLTAHPRDESHRGVYQTTHAVLKQSILYTCTSCPQICGECPHNLCRSDQSMKTCLHVFPQAKETDDGNPSGSLWKVTALVLLGSFVYTMPRWLKTKILCFLCTFVFCTVRWIKDHWQIWRHGPQDSYNPGRNPMYSRIL